MSFDQSIIDSHEQKFNYSCIPSAIEMVLKLLGKVDRNYYNLQNEWTNKKNGNFQDFHGRNIEGVTFEHKFTNHRSASFPFNDLFAEIDHELASDRCVIISLQVDGGWHNYVIHEKRNNDYLAFSKDGKITINFQGSLKTHVENMQGTDILVYKT